MSDPTAPVEGTPDTSSAPESTPAGDPWAPVTDRVGELAGTVGDLAGRFDQFLQSQQPAPEPEDPLAPWAALLGETGEPEYQPEPQGLDPQALQSAFQQAVQQANAPLMQQLADLQTQRAHEQLVARIPQLADTPENAQVRQETAQRVQQTIQNYPPNVQQALMNDAGFIETVFKAAEADKRSQAQVPASEGVPSLEAAGGAVPGGNGQPPSYIQSAHNGAWELPKGLR